MWVYRGGPSDQPVVWYQYAETRSGEVPIHFLYPDGDPPAGAFYLLTDGYSGYRQLAGKAEILGHAACWAHVRRKFVEATEGRKNSAAAHQMLALIGQLYRIERAVRDQSPEERQAIRLEQARPVLDKIKQWLDQKTEQALPKSPLGKAIGYAQGLWPQLTTYLEDGQIAIDNNRAENAIRPFVIGRKNFLFSGSPRGAQASASLYSLIETAKANGHEPWAYLNFLFDRLPAAKTETQIRQLLPQYVDPEQIKATSPL